jgi:hypothetical protein
VPAVSPLPPAVIRELLEKHGYELIGFDEYNWAFSSANDQEPVFVPHTVERVPLEIAFDVARKVGFTDYFDAFHATQMGMDPFPADQPPPPQQQKP